MRGAAGPSQTPGRRRVRTSTSSSATAATGRPSAAAGPSRSPSASAARWSRTRSTRGAGARLAATSARAWASSRSGTDRSAMPGGPAARSARIASATAAGARPCAAAISSAGAGSRPRSMRWPITTGRAGRQSVRISHPASTSSSAKGSTAGSAVSRGPVPEHCGHGPARRCRPHPGHGVPAFRRSAGFSASAPVHAGADRGVVQRQQRQCLQQPGQGPQLRGPCRARSSGRGRRPRRNRAPVAGVSARAAPGEVWPGRGR